MDDSSSTDPRGRLTEVVRMCMKGDRE
jgi:hypothetical protein